ncbi:MAG: 4Fe-4S dicluster domain-containing protein [Phycisphaerae bacterium]
MRLRTKGGYNVPLAGKPTGEIRALPEPDALYLPLTSRRFAFTQTVVEDGAEVAPGEVLATDPANFDVPLLAPRAGTVRLGTVENHITLENTRREMERPVQVGTPDGHSIEVKRRRLVRLGAWQFFEDANTGRLPDPSGVPRAVVVSTARLEPFGPRGDAQLAGRLDAFERGLEHLQSLLEYQPIYLVVPDVQSPLAREVHESLRGLAYLRIVTIPLRYPFDHFALLARGLGLEADPSRPVWALRTEGVLAVDRALTACRACTERIISFGGPAAREPAHLSAVAGYPLEDILAGALSEEPARIINGGALTGETIGEAHKGLDAECAGLTVLAEPRRRELFAFLRPGWTRRSYSVCFLSALRRAGPEPLTTALRGEKRACIACGFCEEVCPARIMPHLIHKYLYSGALDDVERLGVDLCVGCGLCSYVCPSKIELREEFLEVQEQLAEERRHAEEPLA